MQTKIINLKRNTNSVGTFLIGHLTTTYQELVNKFGKPHRLNGDKTLAEWHFISDNGIQFTIYDWRNYQMCKEQITEWHIGGTNINALSEVQKHLPNSKITLKQITNFII